MNKVFAVLAIAGLLIADGPLFGHHSNTIYDMQHTITVQGSVTAVEFINPHVQVRFDVKDSQGKVEKWVGITGPPNALRRAGFDRNTLKPGDQITVDGHRAKDGTTVIEIEKIVKADGPSFSL
jgi:hypothetical protein